MGRHEPICVREKTAAAMLDMQPCEFRRGDIGRSREDEGSII